MRVAKTKKAAENAAGNADDNSSATVSGEVQAAEGDRYGSQAVCGMWHAKRQAEAALCLFMSTMPTTARRMPGGTT